MTSTVPDPDMNRFEVAVPDDILEDLRDRLARTRWPSALANVGWRSGADLDYVRELCAYWQDGFDWRAAEAALNAWPQYTTIIDGQNLHFYHVRSPHPRAHPLLLTHGWPSTAAEFRKVLGALSDPPAYGGNPGDAFHLVVPSIPGFGFSGPVTEPGWHVDRVAATFVTLMERLGYQRYGLHGGDWGSPISTEIALNFPERVSGLHLTMLVTAGLRPEDGAPTDEEAALAAEQDRYNATETAYIALNATKPDTVAFGLSDSPAGLAAWIVEKLRTWTDHEGDHEVVFTREDILTLLTTYWVTNTAASAGRLYFESAQVGRLGPGARRPEVPTGVAAFPKELYRATRRIAEHHYNVQQWATLSHGGHFPAVEQPDLLIGELRTFFRRHA